MHAMPTNNTFSESLLTLTHKPLGLYIDVPQKYFIEGIMEEKL